MTTVDALIRIHLGGGDMKIEVNEIPIADAAQILRAFVDSWPSSAAPLEERAVEPVAPPPVEETPPQEQVAPIRPLLSSSKSAKPSQPRTSSKPSGGPAASSGSVMCDIDGCGRTFAGAHGLQVHKARSHPYKNRVAAARTTKPTAPAADIQSSPDSDDVRMLRCQDCSYTTEHYSFGKLRTHVTTEHGRAPLPGVEDKPRTADDVDNHVAAGAN